MVYPCGSDAKITFTYSPQYGTLYMDGYEIGSGVQSPDIYCVWAGATHTFRYTRDGYQDATMSLYMDVDHEYTYSFTLQPTVVTCASMGDCPTTQVGGTCCIENCNYTCDQYGNWRAGDPCAFCGSNACGQPGLAKIIFHGSPTPVDITVDGGMVITDYGSGVQKCLPVGSHTIVYTKSGYQTESYSITVTQPMTETTYVYNDPTVYLEPMRCDAYLTCPASPDGAQCCIDGYINECVVEGNSRSWVEVGEGCGEVCSHGNPHGTCPLGKTCINGECTTVQQTCDAYLTCPASPDGTQCCTSGTLNECVIEGNSRSWVEIGSCGSQQCPTSCAAGYHCSGALTNYMCVPNSTQSCPSSCPTGYHCSGSLTNYACVPNSTSGTLYTCSISNPSGTCPPGKVCKSGVCTTTASCPPSCATGYHCSGALTNYMCVPDNTQVCPSSCTTGYHCSGAATNYACVPDSGACDGMNRNGEFDLTCILEEQNKTVLYGAIIGIAALILIARR